ncbi:MAG: DegV family protein [Clostridiales bacterium]|nr:DegV family protein [Clostridiales bacterium]
MKIKISADSTCDLSQELIDKFDISIMPLHVSLGDKDCLDGITIQPQDIYDFYAATKKLPKTGACSTEEYAEFYQGILSEGFDAIVHFTISADMSASYANAEIASRDYENVYVVDSRQLSTGIGLLVLDACDMVQQGMSASQIAERSVSRCDAARSSFIVDTLEFLYKGGRCSSLAYLGANLLQIKPCLEVKNGLIGVESKPMGRYRRCVAKYCEAILKGMTNPDPKRCFVTHTKMDEGIAEEVVEIVKSWGIFDEVLETTAGSTVTTHCGANTIGILYINDGGLKAQ